MTAVIDYLHDLRFADLPKEVVDHAKICLLDLIGTGAAGATLPLASIINRHAANHFAAGGKSARTLFHGLAVGPVGAALAGGMTIDALDAHDGHKLTKGHVGCAVLPSLLAYWDAEKPALDGRDFLTQFVLGYELGTRYGIALHATTPDYHTSGAWNAITCAALGARLLRLDRERTRQALGIAEYHGPRSQMMRGVDHPTMLKDGSGWGAMAGVSAAYLAEDGFTGAPSLLSEADEATEYWRDLGSRWRIREQYFKFYPVCRWAQPAIAAVLALRESHAIDPDQIDSVEIVTFHQGRRLAQTPPQTTEQAQYAITFPVAAALVHGDVTAQAVSGEGLGNSTVLALQGLIRVSEADRYNAVFPAERWAHAVVHLKDGRRLESEPMTAPGDPEAPLSREKLVEKYFRLAIPALGDARAQVLHDAVMALDRNTAYPAALIDDLLAPVRG